MKLRNKKTGEIVELCGINLINGRAFVRFDDGKGIFKFEVNSLAELNEDWEDYEEPKESKKYWFINSGGETVSYYEEDEEPEDTEACKEIGDYFETEEEAEKAVEKLKAWKRLKDKGFRFTGYDTNYGHHRASFVFEKEAWATETEPDLDLLFGGEE